MCELALNRCICSSIRNPTYTSHNCLGKGSAEIVMINDSVQTICFFVTPSLLSLQNLCLLPTTASLAYFITGIMHVKNRFCLMFRHKFWSLSWDTWIRTLWFRVRFWEMSLFILYKLVYGWDSMLLWTIFGRYILSRAFANE